MSRKALEWGKTVDSSRSEYLDTVRKIATAGVFSWKYDGYTASILAAYLRAQDEEIKRKETKKSPRVFIGEVGNRMKKLAVTVVRMRYTEGMYGVKTIVTLEAPVAGERAVMTWFASGDKSEDFSEGDELIVDATVKEHEDHETYGKSTIVTRVTVKERKTEACSSSS